MDSTYLFNLVFPSEYEITSYLPKRRFICSHNILLIKIAYYSKPTQTALALQLLLLRCANSMGPLAAGQLPYAATVVVLPQCALCT